MDENMGLDQVFAIEELEGRQAASPESHFGSGGSGGISRGSGSLSGSGSGSTSASGSMGGSGGGSGT